MTQADKSDGDNTASVSAAFSFRSVVLIAVLSTLSSGIAPQCSNRDAEIISRFDRLERKFDDRLDRMAETQARLGERLARVEGTHGRGSQ